MSEIEFLKKTLNEWCERFVGIHVRYAYDVVSEYHIIEVDPESIRRGNDEYKEAEMSWDFSQIFTPFINKKYNNSYKIQDNNEYALAA